MDANRFDHVTRALSRTGTRRGTLGVLSALPFLGGPPARFATDAVGAAKRGKRRDRDKEPDRQPTVNAEKNRKKKCKSPAQTCAGTCGNVTFKCKKRKKTIDCGSCACTPPCDPCFICNQTTRTCAVDPDQQGDACGSPGQVCQVDGACACDANSCGNPLPICVGGACVACSQQRPCPNGCCANDGSCRAGDTLAFCGPVGGACVECAGADDVCTAERICETPACGEPGGPCLVFVTSEAFLGDLEGSGGLAAADGICQRLADDADLPGAYKAWLSTDAVSPSTRFARAQGPYRRVDGVKVADDYDDLTTEKTGGAYLSAAINVTESGGFVANHAAWTFTLPNGTPGTIVPGDADCLDWTSGVFEVSGAFGNVNSSSTGVGWTAGGATRCNHPITGPLRLYCFQQG